MLHSALSRVCPENCLFCPLDDSTQCNLCDGSTGFFLDLNLKCQQGQITGCVNYQLDGQNCNDCGDDSKFEAGVCDDDGSANCDLHLGVP